MVYKVLTGTIHDEGGHVPAEVVPVRVTYASRIDSCPHYDAPLPWDMSRLLAHDAKAGAQLNV